MAKSSSAVLPVAAAHMISDALPPNIKGKLCFINGTKTNQQANQKQFAAQELALNVRITRVALVYCQCVKIQKFAANGLEKCAQDMKGK